MAFGVDNVGGVSGTGLTESFSFTNTAGNLLLVGISIGLAAPETVASVLSVLTYNSVALSAIAGSDTDDNQFTAVAWYRLDSPATGANTLAVTFDQNCQHAIHVISFTDADIAGTPLGTPSIAANTTANPSVTVADSASGDIVVSVVADDNATGATTEAGTIIFEAEDVASDTDHNSQYQTASGANTVCSWTNSGSGDGWAASGVAVKGVGGGGATIVNREAMRRGIARGVMRGV